MSNKTTPKQVPKLLFIVKKFKFSTLDCKREIVEDYNIKANNIEDARKCAKMIVANSKCNENSHTRVLIDK